jgi:ketosteroid isomerase-like protein
VWRSEEAGMTEVDPKALVKRWLSLGISSPEALALVTDDFQWVGPPSMHLLFETDGGALTGQDALRDIPNLDKALYRGYEVGHGNSNVHFMIAEGDIVVMEFDAAFTTFEGEAYHNQYCLVIFVRDGKIAKVHEHADTHYVWDVCLGTSQKRSGVLDRLKHLRAGEEIEA